MAELLICISVGLSPVSVSFAEAVVAKAITLRAWIAEIVNCCPLHYAVVTECVTRSCVGLGDSSESQIIL